MNKIPQTPNPAATFAYLYGGLVLYRAGEKLGLRTLNDYELVLIIDGNVIYEANGSQYPAPPGSVILARPGFYEGYTWDPARRTQHAYIHFNLDRPAADWPEESQWPVVRHQPDPAITGLFQSILQRTHAHPEWPAVAPGPMEQRLLETLITLFLQTGPPEIGPFQSHRPEPVQKAIQWMRQLIDDDPQRAITLAELARVAGVSPKHLCRLFQASIGYGPVQTGILLRLQLALALLTRSNLNIKETADRCGFDNPLYFSRCFTKAYGKPPTQMRLDLAAGIPPRSLLPVDVTPRVYW